MQGAALSFLIAAALFDVDLAGTPRAGTMGALEVIAQAPAQPALDVAKGPWIFLAWRAHPDQSVTGYLVFYGATLPTATKLVDDVTNTNARFFWAVLGVSKGANVCFRLKAYNNDGASDFSPGVCARVT